MQQKDAETTLPLPLISLLTMPPLRLPLFSFLLSTEMMTSTLSTRLLCARVPTLWILTQLQGMAPLLVKSTMQLLMLLDHRLFEHFPLYNGGIPLELKNGEKGVKLEKERFHQFSFHSFGHISLIRAHTHKKFFRISRPQNHTHTPQRRRTTSSILWL